MSDLLPGCHVTRHRRRRLTSMEAFVDVFVWYNSCESVRVFPLWQPSEWSAQPVDAVNYSKAIELLAAIEAIVLVVFGFYRIVARVKSEEM